MTLRIGKHRGKKYSDVCADRPYCAWILRVKASSGGLDKFAKYLEKEHGGILPIGKHKLKFYNEILKEDEDYCAWCLALVKPGEPLKDFVRYLKQKSFKGDQDVGVGSECRICCEGPMNVVLVPCGHRGMCTNCAERLDLCPFCKEPILFAQKCYDA